MARFTLQNENGRFADRVQEQDKTLKIGMRPTPFWASYLNRTMWNIPSGIIRTSPTSNQPFLHLYLAHSTRGNGLFFDIYLEIPRFTSILAHSSLGEGFFIDWYLETPPLEIHLLPTIRPIGRAK